MPATFRDYYKILGVSRSASQDEIRSAFRRLARAYHPDLRQNDPASEAKFKEINEAYEVLGDPDKRSKYDSLGARWKQGNPFHFGARSSRRSGGADPSHGADFQFRYGGSGFSDFFEELFGSGSQSGANSRRASDKVRQDGHPSAGHKAPDVEVDLSVSLQEALHGAVRPITLQRQALCETCYGVGQVNGAVCKRCAGKGGIVKAERYQVRIPVGVQEGDRLRVPGRGEQSMGGGDAGDLMLRVRLENHPFFRVEGTNLVWSAPISPWEAVLGAEITAPTLEGDVKVRIPPGAQSGHRLRLRGRGLPSKSGQRGDLLAHLQIQTPASVTDQERELWRQLAEASPFNPRREGQR